MTEKETLINDLPPPEQTTEIVQTPSPEKNEWFPTNWKKLLVLAISYGATTKLQETPGPLISLFEKLPNNLVARLIVTFIIYMVILWVVQKFWPNFLN